MMIRRLMTRWMMCRICHEINHENQNMISPCKCDGDQQYVHRNCLDSQRSNNDKFRFQCPNCQFYYRFESQLRIESLYNAIIMIIVQFVLISLLTGGLHSLTSMFSSK